MYSTQFTSKTTTASYEANSKTYALLLLGSRMIFSYLFRTKQKRPIRLVSRFPIVWWNEDRCNRNSGKRSVPNKTRSDGQTASAADFCRICKWAGNMAPTPEHRNCIWKGQKIEGRAPRIKWNWLTKFRELIDFQRTICWRRSDRNETDGNVPSSKYTMRISTRRARRDVPKISKDKISRNYDFWHYAYPTTPVESSGLRWQWKIRRPPRLAKYRVWASRFSNASSSKSQEFLEFPCWPFPCPDKTFWPPA